ncbi:MAG: tetratricopeptide repeat protein [Propionibacteriales bacterium]|nr:tetratricopeptide repeat protein [Propionibacteriales bacterium]
MLDAETEPFAEPVRASTPRLGRTGLAAVVVPAAVSLLFSLSFLLRPGLLTGARNRWDGYDDGVYLGAAIRLVHGDLPYRDFAFLHPPGISLLLAPFAAVGEVTSGTTALALARLATVLVIAVNVALAALAVRHRGTVAMATAGTVLACYPLAITTANTVRLEPFLIFFCLLGVTLLFEDGRIAPGRRTFWAGVALGFAGTIKVWAVLPLLPVVVLCVLRGWRPTATLARGGVLGFGLPVLPFFLAAPSEFVRDVIGAQLGRVVPPDLYPVKLRLSYLTGTFGIPDLSDAAGAATVVSAGVAVLLGAGYLVARPTLRPADLVAPLSAAVVVLALLKSPSIYPHYASFAAPYLAMTLGIALSALLGPVLARANGLWAPPVALVSVAVLLGAVGLDQQSAFSQRYQDETNPPLTSSAAVIPRGACVLSDQPMQLIVTDRLAGDGSCPDEVDLFGVWLVRNQGREPSFDGPITTSFAASFARDLARVDYLWVVARRSSFVPWSPALGVWFDSQFRVVHEERRAVIYQRTGDVPPPPASLLARNLSAGELVAQGLQLERLGDVTNALTAYRAALVVDAEDPVANFDVGHLLQDRGDVDGARTSYLRAVDSDPRFVPALYNLGVLETEKNPEAAIEWFRRALKVEPGKASALLNLGVLLSRSGDAAEGSELIERALVLDPGLRSSVPDDLTR